MTINFRLDESSSLPLYQQVVEQVRQLVAGQKIAPGQRLPSVRELARLLHVNQGTIARAYQQLEQERVVFTRRGGGTLIAASAEDSTLLEIRQKRLADRVGSDILDLLGMGYSPEELEATFLLHLARWREERHTLEGQPRASTAAKHSNVIRVVGSNDLALELLIGRFRQQSPEVNVELTTAGSLGGLIALQEGRADLAGIHLLDEETGQYNYPYLRHILPGRELAAVHLAMREQGLLFPHHNPRGIAGLKDLCRDDITFINRQQGSGTRLLLDLALRQRGISPSGIKGYGREVKTHVAVARAIASGEADTGLGIKAAARAADLDFLPLFREQYDLVMLKAMYQDQRLAPLLVILASEEFHKLVTGAAGYDVSRMGETTFYG